MMCSGYFNVNISNTTHMAGEAEAKLAVVWSNAKPNVKPCLESRRRTVTINRIQNKKKTQPIDNKQGKRLITYGGSDGVYYDCRQ